MLRRNLLEETCPKIIHFCNKNFLRDGICIHSATIKLGIRDDLLLGNNLLSRGAKGARHLFDEMPSRDVVSWTRVLSAYVKDGSHAEALDFFHLMKASGINPNEFTLSSVLRSCAALGNLACGACLHACVIKQGFESNEVLCSNLIELYSKCGLLDEAVGVFSGMECGDTVSWTAAIAALVEAGDCVRALQCFIRMVREGVCPNEYTFVKVLQSCGFLASDYGRRAHAQLIVWAAQLNLVLKTALVDMYAKCQNMDNAVKVLNQTPEQDVQLWTTLIAGFARNLKFCETISAFRWMVGCNIVPNSYSYAGILNACASIQALQLGRQVHAQVIMAGLENDVSVGNALLDFHAKCSAAVVDIIYLFKQIALPNVISWSTLIAGLAARGLEDACNLAFLEMQCVGLQPNSFTLSNILQACGRTQSPQKARKIHGYIIKTNADSDASVGNVLVDTYAGMHAVDCAMKLAKGMSNRSVVTYTVLTSRLNKKGCYRHTLEIINHVRNEGILMDGLILSSFLSASANLSAIQTGKQVHCYCIVSGFGIWISVLNSLIDLYGKCRHIQEAQKVFSEISNPNIISWNGLMHSYALSRHSSSALSTLEDMRLAGIRPDSVTLSTVLIACSQDGLVDMGVEYFHSLRELFDIEPQINHYNLVIDLLGKAGRIEEAVTILNSMPICPNAPTYKRLLLACKLHGNMILGEEMARKGLELDPSDFEFNVILASMYYKAGRFDLGDNISGHVKEGSF